MSDNDKGNSGRTKERPTVSTRYDSKMISWATSKLGVSKATLLKIALDEKIARLMREAA